MHVIYSFELYVWLFKQCSVILILVTYAVLFKAAFRSLHLAGFVSFLQVQWKRWYESDQIIIVDTSSARYEATARATAAAGCYGNENQTNISSSMRAHTTMLMAFLTDWPHMTDFLCLLMAVSRLCDECKQPELKSEFDHQV